MKYCKDCAGFDECNTTGRTVDFAVDDGVCIDFDERSAKTNADRIRAMSDEELKYIARAVIKAQDCPMGDTECIDCVFHDLCWRAEYYYNNEEEWLQQAAKGE